MQRNKYNHAYYTYDDGDGYRVLRWKKRREVAATKQSLSDDHGGDSVPQQQQQQQPAVTSSESVTHMPMSGWERMQSDDGHTYYYHVEYGSVWKLPTGAILLETNTELPSGWIHAQGQFFNQFTGEWRQTPPDGEQETRHISSSSDDGGMENNSSSSNEFSSDDESGRRGGSSSNKISRGKERRRRRRRRRRGGGEGGGGGDQTGSVLVVSGQHPIENIRDTLWVAQRRASEFINNSAYPAVTEFGKNVVETVRQVIEDTFYPTNEEIVNAFQGSRTFEPLRSRPAIHAAAADANGMVEVALDQQSSARRGLELAAEALSGGV